MKETVGVLVVTAFRAGGRPVARVESTHDPDQAPEVSTMDSAEELLAQVEAWWVSHWLQGPGGVGP